MPREKCEGQKKKRAFFPGLIPLALLALLLSSAPLASAQGEPGGTSQQLLSAIGQQMVKSEQALTGYSYQQRTEVLVNGETKRVQLSQVAFGPDKQPLISVISVQPPEDTGRGLRGLIKKEEIKDMREEVAGLVQLSNSYLILSPEKMLELASKAQVWVSPDSGAVRVDASGFLQPGDHITINCDGVTKNRMQTQVQTAADGNPMMITAQYQTLSSGLNYNAQTVINVPAKGLQIMINTMNYQQQ